MQRLHDAMWRQVCQRCPLPLLQAAHREGRDPVLKILIVLPLVLVEGARFGLKCQRAQGTVQGLYDTGW